MSIPPLVCSTPPPPDQCDDDRDGEDFDIQYNLSQEDEEDAHNYNYGTYSEYIYNTSTSSNIHQDMWSSDISKKTDNLCSDLIEEKDNNISILPTSDSSSINKLGFDDIVLEDLNLKLEDQNDEAPQEESTNKCDTEPFEIDCRKDTSQQFHVSVNNDKPYSTHDYNENDDIKTFEESITPYIEESNVEDDTLQNYETKDTIEGGTFQSFTTKDKLEDDTFHSITTKDNIEIGTFQSFTTKDNIEDSTFQSFTAKDNVQDGIFQSFETKDSSQKLERETENQNINEICLKKSITTEAKTLETDIKDTILSENKHLADDDFDEFEDFQFMSSGNKANTTEITDCDNPWNSEVSKSSDVGDFTANFDVDNITSCTKSANFGENEGVIVKERYTPNDDTDDFGDFNDFKSSPNECNESNMGKIELSQNVPVLSLNSPDSEVQIIESINSVLNSIFTSELVEPDCSFEGKIESLLNETWGHLLDTDVRQPYIVNWNNSLGQKSLLKALCIDSRNILFGPKWNHSMPKYAANLTVAPLQPKKPVAPTSTLGVEEQNVDKTGNKEIGSWTDPFTSDGQEYTYAEALLLDLEHLMATLDQMAHKNSTFKISELLTNACNSESTGAKTRPANLDVFTNVIPPEMDHIYSSTLPVQPIRQINLPDTHIFTPTDSETPRSKTIHYAQGPAMIVPQQSSETNRQSGELKSKSLNEVPVQNTENDEEYWEFQDFKGSDNTNKTTMTSASQINTDKSMPASKDSLPQIGNSYETQILQPIKVEPVAPALNWPNPGEVKETFDDFSEFISNTKWTNETSNIVSQSESPLKNGTETEDDFETFQSAPTLKCTTPIDTTYKLPTNTNHSLNDSKQSFTSSSDISYTRHSNTNDIFVKSKENLVYNDFSLNDLTIVKDSSVKISPVLNSGSQNLTNMNTTIMQPSVPNINGTQRTQQQTGQILQPLSLESYSQINWPSPGIDLQDLSRFNPLESVQSLKTDVSTGSSSKLSSPAHKDVNAARNEISDDDIWGDFVSSKPKQQQIQPKKVFADDDEWTDFVSSPSVKPQNGLNTISLNVHTNLNMQKNSGSSKFHTKNSQLALDIPTLNYVTPKSSNRGLYNDKHFQNL